jgi:hypothetical protein
MKKFKIKHFQENETLTLNETQLLHEINRDRSEEFTPYDSQDLSTDGGVRDALSLTDYKLIEVLK